MNETAKKHEVDAPRAREFFEEWLARGDAVGVFQNVDLGHPGQGHTIFLPLTPREQEAVTVGKTHAPNTPHRLGWRYILKDVALDLRRFEFT